MVVAPTTQVGRDCMVHRKYRDLARLHIRNTGSMSSYVEDELHDLAELLIPALRIVTKSQTFSLFSPYMTFAAIYDDTSLLRVSDAQKVLLGITPLERPVIAELPITIPEIANSHPDLIERDNASPEPRTIVVPTPVLRLFRAQMSDARLEIVA